MKIELRNGLADIEYVKGKRNYVKTVSIDYLLDSMVSAQGLSTPLLPFGTRMYKRNSGEHTILMEIPEMKRRILYKNRDQKVIFEGNVPMPWGIMVLKFNDNSDGTYRFSTGTNIYALDKPLITMNDPVYFYPLPNIFGSCGICWGNTLSEEDLKFNDLSTAGRMLDTFFASDYNTDLHPRINKYERIEDMFRKVKDESKFPKDVLVRVGTVSNII